MKPVVADNPGASQSKGGAAGLLGRMAPFLQPLSGTVRIAMEQLVHEIGLLSPGHVAEAPSSRAMKLTVEDAGLTGIGWHDTEKDGERCWRWSGLHGTCSTLELPDPGRGPLRFSFHLVMPFGAVLDLAQVSIVVNATPLALRLGEHSTNDRPLLVAEITIPESRPACPFSCVLVLPRYGGPGAADGVGDTRKLGPGLLALEVGPVPDADPVAAKAVEPGAQAGVAGR